MRLWIASEAHNVELAFIIDLISNKRECNNYCFIKDNQKILLDLPDFALQEQSWRREFNGRYFAGMV